nr:hypothetical protein [Clavibacter michiganensis]
MRKGEKAIRIFGYSQRRSPRKTRRARRPNAASPGSLSSRSST